jgi:hypothetical protein
MEGTVHPGYSQPRRLMLVQIGYKWRTTASSELRHWEMVTIANDVLHIQVCLGLAYA